LISWLFRSWLMRWWAAFSSRFPLGMWHACMTAAAGYSRACGALACTLSCPFWQVAKLFNAQILEYSIREGFSFSANKEALGDEPISTSTFDGKDITIEGSILFRLDRGNAPELWENIGENVVSKVVRPTARSRAGSVFAGLSLDQIKHNRSQVEILSKTS
jgi:hypothetical protein